MDMTGIPEGTRRKRAANELLRGPKEDRGDERWPIPFFCECASASCFRTVWLEPRLYDGLREDPEWQPLVPGHEGKEAGVETGGTRAAAELVA